MSASVRVQVTVSVVNLVSQLEVAVDARGYPSQRVVNEGRKVVLQVFSPMFVQTSVEYEDEFRVMKS
jgi:hypothetical protein